MPRILVVDDDSDLREDLVWAAQAVQGPERDVVSASSAAEAIEEIARETFDLVVTDVRMEANDAGMKVLRAAKEKDPSTQVIVITSYGTQEISREVMELGAFDYLERTSPGTDVLAMIRSKINLALEFRRAKLAEKSTN